MHIEVDEKNQYALITIQGDLNLTDARLLRSRIMELIDANRTRIVMDMTQVNSIDSAGVGILIACTTLLKRENGDLAIFGLTRRVRKVLDITAASFFTTFQTEAEAGDHFNTLEPDPIESEADRVDSEH